MKLNKGTYGYRNAHRIRNILLLKIALKRYHIHGLSGIVELHHGLEDDAVLFFVKIFL